jgi:putative FmdB family regulatory protein
MPRYKYGCTACGFAKIYFHGINDVVEVCEKCTQKTMKKILNNTFSIKRNNKASTKTQVGEVTKQHIEDNRKILEDQKKEVKGQTYEPA